MIVTHTINMELAAKDGQTGRPSLRMVQGDSLSRVVMLVLSENGAPWEIPSEAAIQVRYQRPDGTGGIYGTLPDGTPAWEISGNRMIIRLIPQMLAVAGLVRMQVVLLQLEQTLTTFEISLVVETDLANSVLEEKDYVNFQSTLENGIRTALEKAKQSGVFDGVTFVPDVSETGVLSWTNNCGMENPASVNLNAPQGVLPVANGGTGAVDPATARIHLEAAPAGYGLGEGAVRKTAEEMGNCGFIALEIDGTWAVGIRVRLNEIDTVERLTICGNGCRIQRTIKNGLPQEWEWENPPLVLGREYRTTERHNGAPVYTRLVNLGTGPNQTTLLPLHNVANLETPLRCSGYVIKADGSKESLPIIYNTNCLTHVYFTRSRAVVFSTEDLSGATIYAQLWYTKSA